MRIVPPGMTDCKTSLGGLPDFTDLPALPPDTYATIGAEGMVAFGTQTPFTLRPYIDQATVDADKIALRFIHASPGTPPVDVGLGGGALFTPVFTDISPKLHVTDATLFAVTVEAPGGVVVSKRERIVVTAARS